MKLRARWSGPPPRVGDYLAAPTRPRFAYRIGGVKRLDPLVRWDPTQKTELRRLTIEVDRVPIAQMPAAARVHDWRWESRASTARANSK